MKRYAVRVPDTTMFFPAHRVGQRGYNHDDPVEDGGVLGPRLFQTLKGAQNFISSWRQGRTEVHYPQTRRYSFGGDDDDGPYNKLVSVPGRAAQALEIVVYALREVKP